MDRRAFLSALGLLAAPLGVEAQQPAVPLVGWLSARSAGDTVPLVAAFRRGLADEGFVEGQNVTVDYQWAEGQYDRLLAMATELVRRTPTVLASTGGEPAALAAKGATPTIPIVFAIGGDPVERGLAASYSRPGGNATEITLLTNSLEPKRLGLLRELLPRATAIGLLLNPKFPFAEVRLSDAQRAALTINLRIHVLRASTDGDITTAFAAAAQRRFSALAVTADPFFDTRRDSLVALAARHRIPTMYHFREFVEGGGLVSYGIDPAAVYRQVGVYVGRVLKGARPADLPVMQASKFELAINLKTAKALGLTIPPSLLQRADQVIE